jgi:hypothetical protein
MQDPLCKRTKEEKLDNFQSHFRIKCISKTLSDSFLTSFWGMECGRKEEKSETMAILFP